CTYARRARFSKSRRRSGPSCDRSRVSGRAAGPHSRRSAPLTLAAATQVHTYYIHVVHSLYAMRVAVTGANGFVGRHLVAQLLRGGHDVRALISERPGAEKELPDPGGRRLDMRRADVRNPESLRGAFDGIDAIVHTVAVP